MGANVNWDQGSYETSRPREVLPKGRYLCVISDSEEKKTKLKTGSYLEFEFIVKAPKDYAKRKLWARLNVHNPSEEAQRIGREQFNALADCCGMLGKVKKTDQLHDKMVICIVAVTETDQGKETNEIIGFQKYEGAQASAAARSEHEPEDRPAAKPAAKAAARKAPAPAMDDDDDIPF